MLYTVILDTHNPAGSTIDFQAIQDLVLKGVVCGTTQVWNPDMGRWVDAQTHPQLLTLFSSSVWDAWEQDSGFLFAKPKESKKEAPIEQELLVESSVKDSFVVSQVDYTPPPQEPFVEKSVAIEADMVSLEDEYIELIPMSEEDEEEELPMLSDLSLIPLDEVSVPNPMQETGAQQHSLRPVLTPSLVIPPRRERPEFVAEQKRFSFVRVAIPIVMGAFCILGALNYIKSLNTRSYNPPVQSIEKPLQSKETHWSIEDAVRTSVGDEIIPLNPESSFEDILHVELQRVGITSVQVRASVTKWTGRKQEVPKEIDVRLRVEGTGELDRDLTTISLIFAKYIEFYFLDVLRLEVCIAPDEDTFLCTPLNPEVIRRFYLKRIEYDVFFQDVFQSK